MALDGLISLLYIPVLLMLLVSVIASIFINNKSNLSAFKRLFMGMTGSLTSLLLVAGIQSIASSEALNVSIFLKAISLYTVYFVFLSVIFVFLYPLLYILIAKELASFSSIMFVAFLLTLLLTAFSSTLAVNNWCSNNFMICISKSFFGYLLIILPCSVGFAFFARLPLFRS